MFTRQQKLLMGGAFLFAVLLLVAGSYFGRHWFLGPDVEPAPEHLLSDKPRSVSINRPVHAAVSQDTPSVSEANLVAKDESFSDVGSTTDSDEIDDVELGAFLEELAALEEDEGKDFPEVPEGFPSNIRPVWLEDFFDEILHADHVIIDRVLIELWNQGDHDIVYGVLDENTGKVYPIYHDVVYVEWDSYVREDSNGESLEVPYISYRLGISSTVEPLLNEDENLFTEEEIMSGAYVTIYPDVTFVDYSNAGYDPVTVLNDY